MKVKFIAVLPVVGSLVCTSAAMGQTQVRYSLDTPGVDLQSIHVLMYGTLLFWNGASEL